MPPRREFLLQTSAAIATIAGRPTGTRIGELGMAAIAALSKYPKPPSNLIPTTPDIASSALPEVRNYYPEISGMRPRGHDSFQTKAGRHVTWVNFTDYAVDSNAVRHLYAVTSDLAGKAGKYRKDDQLIPFEIHSLIPTRQVVFIVPKDTPPPAWIADSQLEIDAASPDLMYATNGGMTFVDRDVSLTLLTPVDVSYLSESVRKIAPTEIDELNNAFVTEACVGSIIVTNNLQEPDIIGQEVVCNSFAYAMGFRRLGQDYAAYTAARAGANLSQTALLPPINFPQDVYDNLPSGLRVVR